MTFEKCIRVRGFYQVFFLLRGHRQCTASTIKVPLSLSPANISSSFVGNTQHIRSAAAAMHGTVAGRLGIQTRAASFSRANWWNLCQMVGGTAPAASAKMKTMKRKMAAIKVKPSFCRKSAVGVKVRSSWGGLRHSQALGLRRPSVMHCKNQECIAG